MALFCNRILLNGDSANSDDIRYWSSSIVSTGENGKAWGIHMLSGQAYAYDRSSPYPVKCIKR